MRYKNSGGIMRVYILRGISGSGKSTLAQRRASMYKKEKTSILSADTIMYSRHGCFRKDKLQECHAICFKQFLELLEEGEAYAIYVDNTNTRLHEVSPYILAARAYRVEDCDIRVLTLLCDPNIAFARSEHVNDAAVVLDQHKRLLDEPTPPYYDRETMFTSGIV